MKIPEKPEGDKFGFYRIELTEDGFEHFVSEFEEEDDDYGNFIFEFFKEFNSNNEVTVGKFFGLGYSREYWQIITRDRIENLGY